MFYNYYLRRKARRHSQPRPYESFDTTSIGDLSFNLLIFFIVTASFILKEGIFFSLPSKTAGVVQVEARQLVDIQPLNQGFMMEGMHLSREDLKTRLILRKKANRDIIAIIHMNPGVRYERLVDTLSVSRESGISRISLKNDDRR